MNIHWLAGLGSGLDGLLTVNVFFVGLNPFFLHACSSEEHEDACNVAHWSLTSKLELLSSENLVVVIPHILAAKCNETECLCKRTKSFQLCLVHFSADSVELVVQSRTAELHWVKVETEARDLTVRVAQIQLIIELVFVFLRVVEANERLVRLGNVSLQHQVVKCFLVKTNRILYLLLRFSFVLHVHLVGVPLEDTSHHFLERGKPVWIPFVSVGPFQAKLSRLVSKGFVLLFFIILGGRDHEGYSWGFARVLRPRSIISIVRVCLFNHLDFLIIHSIHHRGI